MDESPLPSPGRITVFVAEDEVNGGNPSLPCAWSVVVVLTRTVIPLPSLDRVALPVTVLCCWAVGVAVVLSNPFRLLEVSLFPFFPFSLCPPSFCVNFQLQRCIFSPFLNLCPLFDSLLFSRYLQSSISFPCQLVSCSSVSADIPEQQLVTRLAPPSACPPQLQVLLNQSRYLVSAALFSGFLSSFSLSCFLFHQNKKKQVHALCRAYISHPLFFSFFPTHILHQNSTPSKGCHQNFSAYERGAC